MIDARAFLTLAAIALISPLGCSSSEKPKETAAPAPAPQAAAPETISVERTAEVELTAKVRAIDHATRWITLEDAQGHQTSFAVGPQVQRLDEVKVGDTVAAHYKVSVTADRRAPTPEEAANPIVAVGAAGRAPQGSDPAAGGIIGARVVTTVEAVDVPGMLVTLKGPMGDTVTLQARNPENVRKLRVGDTIIITYAEAVAISLVKQ